MEEHKGLIFLILGIFGRIMSLFTHANVSITLSYLGIVATSMAIIYYIDMFIKFLRRNLKK